MSYNKSTISYKDSGLYSKVLLDYIGGDSKLKSFYEYTPTVSAFAEAIKNVGKYEYSRKVLSSSIKEYYTRNAPGMASEATLMNIKKLEDKNCFTVTTGHQLCLFTGPLYFIFKIISVINLAEKLNKEYPSNHFVPIYWMASEDHDFAEINHANLYGKKVEWIHENIGGPVGKLPLSYFTPVLENLFGIMGDVENTNDLKKIISDSYSSEKTLAEATFSFVNALLGKYGLVVIDPDNGDYKKIFSPVIIDELLNGNSFKIVSETDKKLIEAGIEPQVHSREMNLFYVDEKGRNRIEKKEGKWSVVSGQWSVDNEDEIKKAVKSFPEKFSPNVILRPIYQQAILPNVAYVGGPSEMAYWLQLKGVFDYYKIPFPVLMPRNSALLINKPVAQKMAKLNLEVKDLFKDTESLIKELLARGSIGLPDFEKEKKQLIEAYNSMGNKVKEIDPTLVAFTEAELQKQLNALKTLETKLTRVLKQKEETSVAQIRKIKDYLFPNGTLQERTENFIPFYLQEGPAFFDMLKENFDPFDFSIVVLTGE
jgi:bacillithiol synthase